MIDLSDPGRTTELQRGDERAEGQAIESNEKFRAAFQKSKKKTQRSILSCCYATANFVLLLSNGRICPARAHEAKAHTHHAAASFTPRMHASCSFHCRDDRFEVYTN